MCSRAPNAPTAPTSTPPTGVLVAELTSPSTRIDDLTDKVRVYAKAGVPVYLVLDMQQEEASLFLEPYEHGYKSRLTKPFGEKLYIPDPFGCELDTAGFQAPPDES